MNNNEHQKILKLIRRLDDDGLLSKLGGNCVLAADIVQNMLYADGVNSEIVECQLMIEKSEFGTRNTIKLVGYEIGSSGSNQIDTHVVVVAQGDEPQLIDLSVGYLLDNSQKVIVAPLTNGSSDPDLISQVITDTDTDTYTLYYRKKQKIQLPAMHQKTLIARLQDDFNLRKKYEKIKIIALGALIVSVIDVVINSILLAIKVIEKL